MQQDLGRRRILSVAGRLAFATSAGCLLQGCRIRPSARAHQTSKPSSLASPSSSRTSSEPLPWSQLRGQLAGSLVLPSDSDYAVDKQLYDPVFDTVSPQAIAYCRSTSDVQRCIAFARNHTVAIALRSGGHSYAGYSTTTGLLIDVSHMNQVAFNPATATASVGSGTLQIDLYAQLAASGQTVPGASCPTVGMAGLTLGGGIGVLDRMYGLTCDNLLSLAIVTADGDLLQCDNTQHASLFWACQGGGGGNFGAVTSFEFRTHHATDLTQFTLQWDWAAAPEVVPAWMAWAPQAPDALWSNCLLLGGTSPTSPQLSINGVYVGRKPALESLLDSFCRSTGSVPTTSTVWTNTFLATMLSEAGCANRTVAQCHLPSQNPQGKLSRASFAAKSDFIDTPLEPAGTKALVSGVEQRAQTFGLSGGGVILDACGGAINRVPASATAFVHRNDLCSVQYYADWANDATSSVQSANHAWLTAFYASMRPYVSGYAYQNYIDPTLADWPFAYYGSNLARLIQVKAQYDPDDVFHFAQSIPTKSPAST